MIRIILFSILMVLSGSVFAASYSTIEQASTACNNQKTSLNLPSPGGYSYRDFECSYPSSYYGTNGYTLWSSSHHSLIWDYYYASTTPPACVAPQVRSTTTGLCGAVCIAGTLQNIYVPMGSLATSGKYIFKLSQDRTTVTTVHNTVSVGGCSYDLPLNPKQNTGCFTSQDSKMYCSVMATNNGGHTSGADTAKLPSVSDVPVPSANVGCILSSSGEEICNTNPVKNCGTVNGTNVCMKDVAMTSNGLPATIINGQVVGDTTNVNGQINRCATDSSGVKCINVPNLECGPGTAFVCMQPESTALQPSPLPVPISKDPVTVTKKTSVTNPDNTITKTETTTQDVVGTSPYIVTNQIDASGNVVSTTYQGAIVGPGGGVSSAPGDGTTPVDTGQPGNAGTVDGSAMDGIFGSATTAMQGVNGSSYLSSPVSAPAASTCIPIPMNYKKLTYTFDPCSKLATFKEMFGYLLYIMTAFSIYEIATRRPA